MDEEDNLTEFIKSPHSENKRRTYAKIIRKVSMGVGGVKDEAPEAEKNFVVLQFFPDHISGEKFLRRLASKEYEYLDPETVENIVKVYDTARQDGFPVPATTRYFETKDYYPGILMTDMTEGNKYRVWGYNDNPTDQENETLKNMALSSDNLLRIRNQCDSIVDLANEKKRLLAFHNFHIRQDRKTKDVEVFLLDLDEEFLDPTRDVNFDNYEAQLIFMEIVRAKPEQRQAILAKYDQLLA